MAVLVAHEEEEAPTTEVVMGAEDGVPGRCRWNPATPAEVRATGVDRMERMLAPRCCTLQAYSPSLPWFSTQLCALGAIGSSLHLWRT